MVIIMQTMDEAEENLFTFLSLSLGKYFSIFFKSRIFDGNLSCKISEESFVGHHHVLKFKLIITIRTDTRELQKLSEKLTSC